MNEELLHRIADHALAHPQNVSTDVYIHGTLQELREGALHAAGDIAGLALALTPGAHPYLSGKDYPDYPGSAAVVLHMSPEQANRLISVGFWPEDLQARVKKVQSEREEAEVVAERIRRFIDAVNAAQVG